MTDAPFSFMAGEDSSVEALGKIWGERDYKRRTLGHGDRTRALVALEYLGTHLGFEECGELAVALGQAWAGEDGWDTQHLIKALGATKGQVHIQERPRERGDER